MSNGYERLAFSYLFSVFDKGIVGRRGEGKREKGLSESWTCILSPNLSKLQGLGNEGVHVGS